MTYEKSTPTQASKGPALCQMMVRWPGGRFTFGVVKLDIRRISKVSAGRMYLDNIYHHPCHPDCNDRFTSPCPSGLRLRAAGPTLLGRAPISQTVAAS